MLEICMTRFVSVHSRFVTGEIMSVMRPAGTHNFSVTRLALDDGEIKVIAYQKCADTLFDAVKNAQASCILIGYPIWEHSGQESDLPLRVYEEGGSEVREERPRAHVGSQHKCRLGDRGRGRVRTCTAKPGPVTDPCGRRSARKLHGYFTLPPCSTTTICSFLGKLHMQILDKFIDSPLPLRQVGTRVGSVGTDGIHKAELYLQFTPPTKIAPGDELVLLHFETALNGM